MERGSGVRVVVTVSFKDGLWWFLNDDTLTKKEGNKGNAMGRDSTQSVVLWGRFQKR